MSSERSPDDRERTFDEIWEKIRSAKHYAGQPRNEQSAQSVSLARTALQTAMHSGDESLLLEAWRMMAYTLMADEQYQEAVPFYEQIFSISSKSAILVRPRVLESAMSWVNTFGTLSGSDRSGSSRREVVSGKRDESSLPESVRILGMSIAGWTITSSLQYYLLAADIFTKFGTSRRWLNCM